MSVKEKGVNSSNYVTSLHDGEVFILLRNFFVSRRILKIRFPDPAPMLLTYLLVIKIDKSYSNAETKTNRMIYNLGRSYSLFIN